MSFIRRFKFVCDEVVGSSNEGGGREEKEGRERERERERDMGIYIVCGY